MKVKAGKVAVFVVCNLPPPLASKVVLKAVHPLMRAVPLTSRILVGLAVPIPTAPPAVAMVRPP